LACFQPRVPAPAQRSRTWLKDRSLCSGVLALLRYVKFNSKHNSPSHPFVAYRNPVPGPFNRSPGPAGIFCQIATVLFKISALCRSYLGLTPTSVEFTSDSDSLDRRTLLQIALLLPVSLTESRSCLRILPGSCSCFGMCLGDCWNCVEYRQPCSRVQLLSLVRLESRSSSRFLLLLLLGSPQPWWTVAECFYCISQSWSWLCLGRVLTAARGSCRILLLLVVLSILEVLSLLGELLSNNDSPTEV